MIILQAGRLSGYMQRHMQASQEYDPATRTVVNRGEVLGHKVYVTASGTYAPEVRSICLVASCMCLRLGRQH